MLTTTLLDPCTPRRSCRGVLSGSHRPVFSAGASTQSPRFYPDDPIAREPESQDASKAAAYEQSQMYELMFNLFVNSGARGERPAGEEHQHDRRGAGLELVHQPHRRAADHDRRTHPRPANVGEPPDPSKWVLIREKTSGAHPGFTADRRAAARPGSSSSIRHGRPAARPAPSPIATKIFWALGYNQVESFLTTFDPKNATIDPKATVRRPNGKRTPFTHDDMNVILENVARKPDGTYRVIAGRLLPGKILGGFQYAGTRPDDPNDLVPHEHRRELRALRVFGAWTNLTDLKGANTLDRWSPRTARRSSSTTCRTSARPSACATTSTSGTSATSTSIEGPPSRKRFFTLGFGLSPWQTVDYVEYPSSRQVRGQGVRSEEVAAADADGGLHGDARRRCVLGGAAGGGLHRRDDPRGGPHRASSAIPPPRSISPTC